MLGSGKLDLPKFIEHIIRDHMEPYFRLYNPGQETRIFDVEVTVVRSVEGPLNEAIPKAWDHIEVLGIGGSQDRGEGGKRVSISCGREDKGNKALL